MLREIRELAKANAISFTEEGMPAMRMILAVGALLIATSSFVEAREYKVAFLGEKALKATCTRGGGTSNSGVNSYACTYKNGNIRECNRKTGKCIMVTPQ